MHRGTIKKLAEKGYGFIKSKASADKDLFFHMSDLEQGLQFSDLREGQLVEFDIGSNDRGPKAVGVRTLS